MAILDSPAEEKAETSPLMHKRAQSNKGMAKSRKSAGLMKKGGRFKAMGHMKAKK